jgi:hypothetical protein
VEPQSRPWPHTERYRSEIASVFIDPAASPARHPCDLARVDQSLYRSASTEIGRKTLDHTIRDEVSDPVDELRLSERLLEPLALGAYSCIAPSRMLRAPGHPRTLPDR